MVEIEWRKKNTRLYKIYIDDEKYIWNIYWLLNYSIWLFATSIYLDNYFCRIKGENASKFVREEGACRNSDPGPVTSKRRKDRSREDREVNTCPARQVISLMQPRRIHPTKCTSLRRAEGGRRERWCSVKKKRNKNEVYYGILTLGRMHRREVHASQTIRPPPPPPPPSREANLDDYSKLRESDLDIFRTNVKYNFKK